MKEFIDCIRENKQPRANVMDAKKDIEVAYSMVKSFIERKSTILP